MADTSTVGGWLAGSPEFLAALTLIAGIVLAFLLRMGVGLLGAWANQLADRGGARSSPAVTPVFIKVLQFLAFWGVLLVAVVRSLALFGAHGGLMDEASSLIARLLIALAIVAVGYVLGALARNLVAGLVRNFDAKPLSQAVFVLILAVSAIMALAHLGLDVSLVTNMVLVFIAISLAALGLAFALGARSLVANLAAQPELARYRPGDRLRVDETEGTVLEIDRTAIVLATPEGIARIPAARLADSTVVMLSREREEDG